MDARIYLKYDRIGILIKATYMAIGYDHINHHGFVYIFTYHYTNTISMHASILFACQNDVFEFLA